MTAKELERRNGRAQQLRVIEVEEGSYFVESSDRQVAYKATLTSEKAFCACLDFQNHQHDPDFRCKHLLAILNCLPEDAVQKKEFLVKRVPKLEERFIKNIEGKDFVLYAGLLDLAHQKGLNKMQVEILQFPTGDNGQMAIVRALAESKLGDQFVDVGDANPANCNAKVVKHLLRMASTRAKARALRDFTNIGMTCLEELGDLNEIIGEESNKAKSNPEPAAARKTKTAKSKEAPKAATPPAGGTTPATLTKASEAQKRAIHNLSKRRGLSLEALEKLALEAYGTNLSELTVADASQMIRHLQQSA